MWTARRSTARSPLLLRCLAIEAAFCSSVALQRPAGERAQASAADPNVEKLAQDVAEKLGATVAIQHALSGRGKLVISYNSLDELDGILAHIQ